MKYSVEIYSNGVGDNQFESNNKKLTLATAKSFAESEAIDGNVESTIEVSKKTKDGNFETILILHSKDFIKK